MSESVFLVGFMGSGKSTVGRKLAECLDLPFADLDDDIERREGCTIAGLFSSKGEEYFRDAEHAALVERVSQSRRGEPLVLALGGGAYTFARNRELLVGAGHTVWLDIDFARALARVEQFAHRPLARDPRRFEALYHARIPHYRNAGIHIRIESDDPMIVVRQIREALP